jgi:6-phosphogluconolactonase
VLVHYPDKEALALAAADIFFEQFKIAIDRSGRFTVLLSGGNTPKLMYKLLAQEPFKTQIDWSLVNIFWGDERCVESNDPLSNYLMASETFLFFQYLFSKFIQFYATKILKHLPIVMKHC